MLLINNKSKKNRVRKLKKLREYEDISHPKNMRLAVGRITCLLVLIAFTPWYHGVVCRSLIAIRQLAFHIHEAGSLHKFTQLIALMVLKVSLSLVVILLASALSHRLPDGWIFIARRIPPGVRKCNPLTYIKHLTNSQRVAAMLKVLLKCALLLVITGIMLQQKVPLLLSLESYFLNHAIIAVMLQFTEIMQRFIMIIALFALLDIPLNQFMFFKKSARWPKKSV